MSATQPAPEAGRSRLIKAESGGWWFLGDGGFAKLRAAQVTPEGELSAGARQFLRERGLYDKKPYSSYSLTVLTSTDCNLGCGYCFQNTGQDEKGGHRPPRIKHARLTSETITEVLDFTRERMAAAELHRLSLMLFGGEPLLNPRGARELLRRAAELGQLDASMVSNGTLLTPLIAKELNAAGLGSIQITFDGDQAEHDAIRIKRSGGGTFDLIVHNVAKAMATTSLRWHLRINVSHHNRHGMDALVERLAERLDVSRCGIQFALIGDVGVGYRNDLAYGGSLAGEFTRWHARALELGFAVSRPKPNTGCQACSFKNGQYGAVINADGVLSSCWETAGQPGWEVGSLAEGYRSEEETEGRWITCYDQYRYDEEEAARLAAFQDEVDAALLDRLNAAGRL
ncbi:radical SAM protein [Kitasatospora sp. MMS16-BH015]|uniref:radical SAM protein n=1 Tax=Kitasatospora sp. MMS16-BH015 TaxID=2018025 RepID=UPI000CA30FB1|nr:radical SAM protein [Kitasatospora sp. MMS16-BH015]AUG78992.1 radical SAM protein [Kitasatospora sp. MMS16-BH015]